MLELTNEDKLLIESNNHKWIDINGIRYFIKSSNSSLMLYSEIVAEKVAKMLGIRCAHYEATLIRGKLYYLSKDLSYEGPFVLGENISVNLSTLYDYWNILEQNYGTNVEAAINDLVRISIFDIILMNNDRFNRNWALINNESGIHIYAFDNENILSNDFTILKSGYSRSDNLKSPFNWENYDGKVIKENMLELEYFLRTSALEYVLMVEDMVKKITPEIFGSLLDSVELEYQDKILNKSKWLKIYTDNYNAITTLLESRGKDGKRIH